jgi:hypothetical protein
LQYSVESEPPADHGSGLLPGQSVQTRQPPPTECCPRYRNQRSQLATTWLAIEVLQALNRLLEIGQLPQAATKGEVSRRCLVADSGVWVLQRRPQHVGRLGHAAGNPANRRQHRLRPQILPALAERW